MSTNATHTNRLINESSPYLLQHARNPVDWFPWSDEAFEKAKAENKPVLVSIGYSSCHWCHVMERESFESVETAAFMNEHFVNVKVDREERPDVDHIYMEAVQAMAGQGGWPLNVFLTPDRKPFYGGTYFPPRPAHGRSSWVQILNAINEAWTERRDAVADQAELLTKHLQQTNALPGGGKMPELETAFDKIKSYFDRANGGFGHAPKFPNTASLLHLMRHYKQHRQPAALEHVTKTLDNMLGGGIYDQLGGGLCRYSTDERWLAPHFEKMLYDNAQFVSTLADAYRITKSEHYKSGIHQTLEFIQREMTSDEGLFYSALDADSEGVEGKFYVWQYDELKALLTEEEFKRLDESFDITPEGNWEHSIILERKRGANNWTWHEPTQKKMMAERDKRVRPGLDDKIIVSWNALMQQAFIEAGLALNHAPYIDLALRSIDKLLEVTLTKDGALQHNYKNGKAYNTGILDDYAQLALTLVRAAEASGNMKYIHQAVSLGEYMLANFYDDEQLFFRFTEKSQTDLPAHKIIYYDGVTPSGNAAAYNLFNILFHLTGKSHYGEIASSMEEGVGGAAVQYPTSFGNWLCWMFDNAARQVVVINSGNAKEEASQLGRHFLPNVVLLPLTKESLEPDVLAGKYKEGETRYYVCHHLQCDAPLPDFNALQQQLGIE